MRLGAIILGAALLCACGDETVPITPGGGTTGPTYHEHVAPILAEHCLSCHVEGGIGPFLLDNYSSVSSIAGIVASEVETRSMPPWHVDNSGDCNTWQDARWLTDEQIDTILTWVEAGAPEGDPSLAKAPPAPPPDLDEVSITLDTGFDYEPDASATDDYRCFVIDPGLASDQYVTAYQVKPGLEAVVHHVILYASSDAGSDAEAEAADAADPGPGFACFGDAGIDGGGFVAGWAPGTPATRFPEDTGIPIGAGRKLVVQIHYNTVNAVGTDRTTIDLTLAASVPKPSQFTLLRTQGLALDPGMASVEASSTLANPAPIPLHVYGAFPHMHKRGRTLRVDSVRGSDSACVVDVPHWDFNWQQLYLYEEPLLSMPGDLVTITCGYDTLADTETVTWGEGTEDEMCLSFFYIGP